LAVKAPFIESLAGRRRSCEWQRIYAVSVIVAEAFKNGLPFASRACTTGWLARAIPAIPTAKVEWQKGAYWSCIVANRQTDRGRGGVVVGGRRLGEVADSVCDPAPARYPRAECRRRCRHACRRIELRRVSTVP